MPELVGIGRLMTRRKLGILLPGSFDAMQGLQPAFSGFGTARLRASAPLAPAYRAFRTSDSAEQDWPGDTTAVDLATWGQAAGAAAIYGKKWYDQFGAGFNSDTLTTGVAGQAPELDCSMGMLPVPVFNGTTNRITWSGASPMVAYNTTALVVSLCAAEQVPSSPAGTGAIMCSSQASGNTIRAGLAVTGTPQLQARTVRVDAGSAFGSNHAWNANVHIHFAVADYPNHLVSGFVDGVADTPTSIGATLTPAFVNSGSICIGGMTSSLFTAMKGTCWVFYQVDISANKAVLEAAFEAAA